MRSFYFYILTNKRNGTLYTGVTNNLYRRVYEHKKDLIQGFTKKYKCHDLIYFEETKYINDAIYREKQVKHWKREWKIKLIEEFNPEWRDLYYDYTE